MSEKATRFPAGAAELQQGFPRQPAAGLEHTQLLASPGWASPDLQGHSPISPAAPSFPTPSSPPSPRSSSPCARPTLPRPVPLSPLRAWPVPFNAPPPRAWPIPLSIPRGPGPIPLSAPPGPGPFPSDPPQARPVPLSAPPRGPGPFPSAPPGAQPSAPGPSPPPAGLTSPAPAAHRGRQGGAARMCAGSDQWRHRTAAALYWQRAGASRLRHRAAASAHWLRRRYFRCAGGEGVWPSLGALNRRRPRPCGPAGPGARRAALPEAVGQAGPGLPLLGRHFVEQRGRARCGNGGGGEAGPLWGCERAVPPGLPLSGVLRG